MRTSGQVAMVLSIVATGLTSRGVVDEYVSPQLGQADINNCGISSFEAGTTCTRVPGVFIVRRGGGDDQKVRAVRLNVSSLSLNNSFFSF